MTCPDFFDKQIDLYAQLSLQPAWRDFITHRVRELEACKSGLWLGLGAKINARRKELRSAGLAKTSGSASPGPEKQP